MQIDRRLKTCFNHLTLYDEIFNIDRFLSGIAERPTHPTRRRVGWVGFFSQKFGF